MCEKVEDERVRERESMRVLFGQHIFLAKTKAVLCLSGSRQLCV